MIGERSRSRRLRRPQRGYAILVVLLLLTLLVVSVLAVSPNILTEGRREKEEEMVWRGKQYARGVKMYYRKTGKFPTSLDDLTKPKLGNLRFMRQAYKDPMNTKDGEWRLIYVGPTGQLIGSLKPQQALNLSSIAGASMPGIPAGQVGSPSFGQGLGQAANSVFGNGGAANGTMSASPDSVGTPPTSQRSAAGAPPPVGSVSTDPGVPASSDAAAQEAASQALLDSDPPTVMGGNIIGVGSKIKQPSIMVYEKAHNYKQFEFIWDPSKDAIAVGAAAPGTPSVLPIGTPANGAPGTNNNPNAPAGPNPEPNPPETTPNPPPPPQ
ncbi:MAG TPA: hypothetical protein VMT51_06930 [Dongiaceae bacterium]|nr:hypothetical protein [Dongiaceae bacterium]